MTFARQTMEALKVAAMIVTTKELVEAMDPATEASLRADLVDALVAASDTAFIDPDNAGVADEMPAAVTNGVTPISSTADIQADIERLSDMTTALTVGDGKAAWVVPYDFDVSEVFTAVVAAQSSSGPVTIDARISGGATIFTTPPSIDASENTSLTGTAAVLATTSLTKGQIIILDQDGAGTGAKGMIAVFVGHRT